MAFWQSKFAANVTRDRLAISTLESLGWSVLVIWECEIQDAEALRVRLVEFLKGDEASENSRGKQ